MNPAIIVPLDGSSAAEQALPYANALAQRSGGSLQLISVIEIPHDFGEWSMGGAGAFGGADVDRWLAESEAYLKGVAERIDGGPAATVVKLGSPAGEIRNLARSVDNPVIVMASHGRSGPARFFLGSVAVKVVHDAGCPVLVVRAREQAAARQPAFDRILVPLDGSEFGDVALTRATAVFGEQLTLHLVRVIEAPAIPIAGMGGGVPLDHGLVAEYLDATRDLANEHLQKTQERLASAGHTVTVETREGQVAEAILKAANEQQVDAIAMATHGRGGVGRLVFGSVAERVLQQA
ncbi:MAG: universal stress protein, partial [Vicinamibacterales bacterium]